MMDGTLNTAKYGSIISFYLTTKEVISINIAIGHSSLEAISQRYGKKEAHFDYFNKFYNQDFGIIRH